MPKNTLKSNKNQNGNALLPTARDLREKYLDKVLTADEKELLRATRAVTKALAKEREKYGTGLEAGL